MESSEQFDGMASDEAKTAITEWLAATNKGRSVTTWRLRDWGISRQRYWGNTIPYVYGDEQGAVPLRSQDLPVRLPEDVTFDGVGNPIEKHPTWATTDANGEPLQVQGATGREPARRETDTMDTFVQSSWYFARFTCPTADKPLNKEQVDHWLPVDLYVGGIEHACMHLLYARFFQKPWQMWAIQPCANHLSACCARAWWLPKLIIVKTTTVRKPGLILLMLMCSVTTKVR